MGKKLAIKGHSTRGNEVIALLEMMGGTNPFSVNNGTIVGNKATNCYHIPENTATKYISWGLRPEEINSYKIFTLEEFLEKYPFKIGDKVVDKYGESLTIKSMSWSTDCETMVYDFEDSVLVLAAEDMKLIDDKCERTHEDAIFDSIIWHLRNSVNNGKQNLSGGECEDYFREVVKKNKMKTVLAELLEHIKTTPKDELEREFEEIKEWSNVGPTVEEFMDFCNKVNKKPKYPTTYEECCKFLRISPEFLIKYSVDGNGTERDAPLIRKFIKLKRCRDVYWKIAGEEMGLGKPWSSEYGCTGWGYWIGYNIHTNEVIYQDSRILMNHLLVFPTAEMRDAFYENFKDLIEQCKELL